MPCSDEIIIRITRQSPLSLQNFDIETCIDEVADASVIRRIVESVLNKRGLVLCRVTRGPLSLGLRHRLG